MLGHDGRTPLNLRFSPSISNQQHDGRQSTIIYTYEPADGRGPSPMLSTANTRVTALPLTMHFAACADLRGLGASFDADHGLVGVCNRQLVGCATPGTRFAHVSGSMEWRRKGRSRCNDQESEKPPEPNA